MEEILKTTLLEYEKSAFLIDLVKHNTGRQYVRIIQTIEEQESYTDKVIKINPSLLDDIVSVLNSYRELIPGLKDENQAGINLTRTKAQSGGLTESAKTAIQNRYLKGVSISDLAIQFDCKKELIEQILNNNGISIVDNTPPKSFYKRFKSKKR